MPNVWVEDSFITFEDHATVAEEGVRTLEPEYLHRREIAERAAAKRTIVPAARAAHQQLAQMYAQRRAAVQRTRT
jgi:hypothetical protein